MVYVFLWLIFGIIASIVASSRGQSGCGFFLLGMLLGPLAFLLFISPAPNQTKNANTPNGAESPNSANSTVVNEFRACPYCAEMIKPAAIKCRYCGSEIEPLSTTIKVEPEPEPEPEPVKPILTSNKDIGLISSADAPMGEPSSRSEISDILRMSSVIVAIVFTVWMIGSYLTRFNSSDESSSVSVPDVIETVYVKTPVANIRAEASTNAEIVTTKAVGDELDVVEKDNGWLKILINDEGETGWIANSLTIDFKPGTKPDVTVEKKRYLFSSESNGMTKFSWHVTIANNTAESMDVRYYPYLINQNEIPVYRYDGSRTVVIPAYSRVDASGSDFVRSQYWDSITEIRVEAFKNPY